MEAHHFGGVTISGLSDYVRTRNLQDARRRHTWTLILVGVLLAAVFLLVGLVAYDIGRRRNESATAATHPSISDREVAAPVDVQAVPQNNDGRPRFDALPAAADVIAKLKRALRAAQEDREGDQAKNLDAKQLVALVEPAVVRIVVNRHDGRTMQGSGFILKPMGIVTNYHVIEGAKDARIALKSGETVDVLGFTAILPRSDLALLSASIPQSLPSLRLAEGQPVKGDDVWAFGAPRGLAGTPSKGIVSENRTGKQVRETLGFPKDELDDTAEWVQTDAAINPGNSGGPLINARGEVVGVVALTHVQVTRQGKIVILDRSQNLNFAVGASEVRRLVAHAGRVRLLASLPPSNVPIRDAPAPPAAPPPVPQAPVNHEQQRLTAMLERINQDRVVLIRQKEALEARIADLQWTLKTAQLEYSRLQVEAAAIDRAGQSVDAEINQLRFKLSFERDPLLRATYESRISNLSAESRALHIRYDARAAQASKVKAIGSSLYRTLQAGQMQRAYLYAQAETLRLQYNSIVGQLQQIAR